MNYEEITKEISILDDEQKKIESKPESERTEEDLIYYNYLENEIKDKRREQLYIKTMMKKLSGE